MTITETDIDFLILTAPIAVGLLYLAMGGQFERYREWRRNRRVDKICRRLFNER